jgi:hypothetical protein
MGATEPVPIRRDAPSRRTGELAAPRPCRRLTELTPPGISCDYAYRLPTEASEYACRAGTTTRFSFGDDAGCAITRTTPGSAGTAVHHPSHREQETQPVALYDMHGNVLNGAWMPGAASPGGTVTNVAVFPAGRRRAARRVLCDARWCPVRQPRQLLASRAAATGVPRGAGPCSAEAGDFPVASRLAGLKVKQTGRLEACPTWKLMASEQVRAAQGVPETRRADHGMGLYRDLPSAGARLRLQGQPQPGPRLGLILLRLALRETALRNCERDWLTTRGRTVNQARRIPEVAPPCVRLDSGLAVGCSVPCHRF